MKSVAIQQAVAYTAQRAAEASGLPRQTIDAAIKAGELQATKSGRRHIVLAEDLVAWLKRCRERGEIPSPVKPGDRERLAELNRARRASTA